MRLQVDKNWNELVMVMTEDGNGRVRAGDEAELMALPIEEFFMKLLVFNERMEARIEAAKNKTKH